ncbi:MAG: glycosyltransferase family 4 protein [Oscillatoriales cyanobacterium SM2_2_1]|nr:glycosyltransferase family 4 protein [Oscillatoriales cyanobacterium SM2_2_1]
MNGTSWDLVLTIAEGWQWHVALKVSKRLNLPLVTIFHDWWPEVVELPSFAQRLFEKRIHDLAAASKLIFCVSEGMKARLGNKAKSVVLYPIPNQLSVPKKPIRFQSKHFTLAYAGMLNSIFATSLHSLSKFIAGESSLELRLFGGQPEWETPFYRGFVTRSQLEDELSQADALLVVVSFDLRRRVWAETSFPSKLVEYCCFGRPIILWTPEYSAAAVWAKTHGAAMVVSQAEPEAVLEAIARLKGDPQQQQEFGQKARHMAETLFHPDRIQEQFVQGLERVVGEWRGQHG